MIESSPVPMEAEPLNRSVSFGFFQPVDITKEILPSIAAVYFENRLEVDPRVSGTMEGRFDDVPLVAFLDAACERAACTWSTEGEPKTLVVRPRETSR